MNWNTELIDWVHRFLRVCPVCGSSELTGFLVCGFCWRKLQSAADRSPLEGTQMGLRVMSLWSWVRDQGRAQSILLDSMKGSKISEDWRTLAEKLSQKILQNGTVFKTPLLFVPCPGKRDHARQLSLALSDLWQAPAADLLLGLPFLGPQKDKSKWERSQIFFQTVENFSHRMEGLGTLVFVDDVVTTGSTARAAYEALGRPPSFMVWCLAHRHLAASKSL